MSETPPPRRRSIRADRGDERRRLDRVLVRHLADVPEVSRTVIQGWIEGGFVEVEGEVAARAAEKVRTGDRIEVTFPPWPPPPPRPAPQEMPIEVIYEDDHLLAVAKPPGIVVHPAYGHREGTLLNALLWHAENDEREGGYVGLVHRLDKDTSGVLLAARTRLAHARIGQAIEARRLGKEYLAIVYGRPPVRKGQIDLRIRRDPADRRRMLTSHTEGKESTTRYQLVSEKKHGSENLSLLRLELVTGRTHQLRVHLAQSGMPIVGDPVYGEPRWRGIDDVELATACREFPRQALHAWRLRLEHPESGEELVLEAPLPRDMAELAEKAGLKNDP